MHPVKEEKITVGEEFLHIDSLKGIVRHMRHCILVDCYYREGILHLILRDIRSRKVFTINHALEYPESNCTWLLLDLKYYADRDNINAVQSYCGCDIDSKNRSNIEISQRIKHDDLLQFDF